MSDGSPERKTPTGGEDPTETVARLLAELRTETARREKAEATLEETYSSLMRHQQVGRMGDYRYNGRTGEAWGSRHSYELFGFDLQVMPITFEMWTSTIVDEDRQRTIDEITEQVNQRKPLKLEYRVTAHGVERLLSSMAEMHEDANGDPMYYGVLTDITEERAAEAALAHLSSELDKASRLATLGELAGSIIHEINQPLAAIMNGAEACHRWLQLSPPESEEAKVAAVGIVREAERAGTVVRGLKSLVRGSQMQLAPLQINDVIREVLALSRVDLERLRIPVRATLSDELPLLTGDRVQLQQVVLNLVRNGMDAMRSVDTGARSLLLTSKKVADDHLLVEVQDCGIGIDPAHMSKLFETFFTTKQDGLGFGLSISRKILTAHGGRIWAEPGPGCGLKVSFILPTRPS